MRIRFPGQRRYAARAGSVNAAAGCFGGSVNAAVGSFGGTGIADES
ncbi:MAG: hypothetical protein GX936_00455 [Clostridiales bacterium]|nr:hypothetical protein [Clostridiales bacterium]